MADQTVFETRLTAALRRYADLAPTMDDEAVAHAAIEAAEGRRAGWSARIRGAILGPIVPARPPQIAYLLVILALLLAAIMVAVASGYFRSEPLPVPGRNGEIVYTFQGNDHTTGGSVAIDAAGTGKRTIEAGRCPTYSRDGNVLAWLSYEGSVFLAVRGPGQTPPRKLLLVEEAQQEVSFALSPDGGRVAWFKPVAPASVPSSAPDGGFTSVGPSAELWVAPVGGNEGTRIVSVSAVPGEFYDAPVWSPDGRSIAFGTYLTDPATGAAHRTAIDAIAADGSNRRRVTSRPSFTDDGKTWSPDGRYLAYVGVVGDTAKPTDMFVVSADGTDEHLLTDTRAAEHHPVWSPDGAFLGFETSADGEADRVTTIGVDGASPLGPPALGPASDWFVWSPDGRQVLWQELSSLGSEKFQTTIHAIDREFRQPPTTLQVVDGLVVCTPTWQRLEG
jgi:hypothetical protein